jgi:RNA polymerase sigma-70 factor (ECF subfamily)
MDKKIDAQLVSDYKSGNQIALAKLVRRWHKPFCNKAYWIVKDADLAKDIAQDSWTTIIERINSLKDESSFGGWAMRIVYSKSLDELRKHSRKKFKQETYKNEVKNETISEAEEDNQQLKILLLKSMKNLPGHQQIVIKLFYVQNYSLREISNLLKISTGTVKSRLFHARETLRLILNEKRDKY